MCLSRVLVPLLSILLVLAAHFAKAAEEKASPEGRMVTSFRWETTPCNGHLIPDTPARAFRRSDNSIVVVASSDQNWILIGQTFESLRPQCTPVLSSSEALLGLLWIEATFTQDGKHVDGLATRALPDSRHLGCHSTQGSCWLNDLVAVKSEDGGRSFSVGDVVASVRTSYKPDQNGRIGFFTTTNIAFHDGGYYALFSYTMAARDGHAGSSGNCLVHTDDVGDPSSWRAWDGHGFNRTLRNVDAQILPCDPVSPTILSHEARSLTYVTAKNDWIVVFSDRIKLAGDMAGLPGFYMASSSDLVHWSGVARLMVGHQQREPGGCNDFVRYPSLIDPNSHSRNFDTIDTPEADVFFTYNHLKNCVGTYNRDLDYISVPLSP
jgi:hypothetical protein